jgi:YD repeat-containing protein
VTYRGRIRPALVTLGLMSLGWLSASTPAEAALPQVSGVQVQTSGTLSWGSLPGTAGYNVYTGDVAGLPAGNYGSCLFGSLQGQSALPPGDPLPLGAVRFFLVDGFDESGEGQLADPPGASPSIRCVPARRFFALTQDGDPGDGIADGSQPLRNPDFLLTPSHAETGAVLLHSGEFVLSAVDLDVRQRNEAGTLLHELGHNFGLSHGGSGDEVHTDKFGRVKVQFHWDRDGSDDPDSSDWVRVPGESSALFNGGKVYAGRWQHHGSPSSCLECHATSSMSMDLWLLRRDVEGGSGQLCRICHLGHGGDSGSSTLSGAGAARSYRSQIHYAGPLGRGWDFPANARLTPSGSDALFFDGTGRRELFQRLDASRFAPAPGRYALLFQNADGSFTLRDRAGFLRNFHAFDESNRQGVLESMQSRQGDQESLLYDSQGLLTDVVDPLGRTIHYAYDPQGRITTITDFAGRQVVYSYDAGGNLTSVRSPIVTGTPNGNDFPSGRTTQYTYSSGFADDRLNGNLIGVIRPDESGSMIPSLQNAYGTDAASFTFDRVISQTIGGTSSGGVPAGGTLTYAYQALNPGGDPANLSLPRRRATVIDRNGNQKVADHNVNGNCLFMTEFTNRNLRPGEGDYTTQLSYNSDGELILVIRPQGDRTALVYDRPGADRYREGDLLTLQDTADSLASGGRGDGHGAESNDRIWTFTYEPVFNGIASLTEPRGNDPTYVPQNGGANSPARYTWSWIYDLQEGDPDLNGITAYAARFGISLSGGTFNLGDVNVDGSVTLSSDNNIAITTPQINLDPSSNEAAILGGTIQSIQTRILWNSHGQPTALVDPEQNRHEFQYYPETDPDGDGTPTPPPLDGRSLDSLTGGYLKTERIDTISDPGRDNGTNPGPIQMQYDMKYDPTGTLSTLVDGRGVATRFIHNALGELVEVHRAAATADASGPDGTPATGRGETGLTPFAYLLDYAYDADGNLVSAAREDRGATRGLGASISTLFSYDILGDLVQSSRQATPASSLTTQLRYDANQNPIRITEPDGNSHNRAYDERDLLLTSTRGTDGPLGGAPSARHYDYDGDGDLTRLTDGRGGLTDYLYDGHDRLARAVDPVGGTQDLFYDPASDPVRLLSRGTPGGPSPTDRSGSGNVDLGDLRLLYDEAQRLFRKDAGLFVPSGVLPVRPAMIGEGPLLPGDGAVNTIFEYDRLSRPTFLHEDSGATTRADYDGAGRALKGTDAAGDTVEMTYDAGSNPVESLVTEIPTQPGPVQEQFFTTLFYDALGRGTMGVDNLGETGRALYDSLDAVTTASDANGPSGGTINRRSTGHTGMSVPINGHGNVTRFTYDGADRPLTRVQVLTASGKGNGTTTPPPDTSNPSNPDGLITETTVWTGDGLPGQWMDDRGNATSYAYDNLDRAVHLGRSDGTAQQISYDPEDAPSAFTDPNGSHASSVLDSAGRLTSRNLTPAPGVSGTTLQTYEYDGLSRLTRSFDNNQPSDSSDDAATVFLHDSLGRLIEETQSTGGGAGGLTLTTDLGWQAADLMTQLTYPSLDQVMYGYDGADRLRSMHDMMHPELMATFEYFGLDRLESRLSGNGVKLTFLDDAGTTDTGYDGAGRPVRLRHLGPTSQLLAGFEYRYDRVGNRSSARRLHDTNAGGNARGNVYAYDSASRLISSQEGYLDASHNIVGAILDQVTWTLDGAGNWASFTRNGSLYLDTPNNLDEYDEPQCCGTHTEDGLADDFMDLASTPFFDGRNFVYDNNGNQIQGLSIKQQVMRDDVGNRRSVATDLTTGSPIASYAYDGLGRRVRRRVTGGEGSFGTWTSAYAGRFFPEAVEERDASGSPSLLSGVGPGGGCLWHLHGDGSSQYVLEDGLGSSAAVTPGIPAGGPPGVLERVVYDPYGKPIFESAGNVPLVNPGSGFFIPQSQYDNHHLFLGMAYDPELGARTGNINTDIGGIYATASSYDPGEGRPLSGDPGRPPNPNFGGGDNPTSGFAPAFVEKNPGPGGAPAWSLRQPGPNGREVAVDFLEGDPDRPLVTGKAVGASASAMMESMGIFYFFEHTAGGHQMIGAGRSQEVVVDFLEGDPDRPLVTGNGHGPVGSSGWKDPGTSVGAGVTLSSDNSIAIRTPQSAANPGQGGSAELTTPYSEVLDTVAALVSIVFLAAHGGLSNPISSPEPTALKGYPRISGPFLQCWPNCAVAPGN